MAQIKNITLGTKYVDRKTLNKEVKRIGEVIEVNEKTKTVTLQFEDGKTRPFVVTTLSKSFMKLDDVAEEKEPAVAVGDTPLEDVAGDGTPYAEVAKEIAEGAKKKAEEHKKLNESAKKTSEIINKAEAEMEEAEMEEAEKKEAEKEEKSKKAEKKPKKVKVDNSAEVKKLVDFIFNDINNRKDCSVGVPRSEDMKFRALRINKRQFCKLMWSGKGIRLYFRCDVNSVCPAEKVNYALPYLVIIDKLTKETEKIITGCFNTAVDFELSSKKDDKKKSKKKEKAEKVESEKTE